MKKTFSVGQNNYEAERVPGGAIVEVSCPFEPNSKIRKFIKEANFTDKLIKLFDEGEKKQQATIEPIQEEEEIDLEVVF